MSIFTTKQNVLIEDIGQDLNMSNRGFLRVLQETANGASSKVGHGLSDIDTTHTTWILLYWRLKIFKRPKYNDILTINTWASFSKKIYSTRSFEIYCNNDLIAIADSKWVFANSSSHSIEKISDDIINAYEPEEKTLFDSEFKDKRKMPENIESQFTYTAMKRDLDANHHVNNISFLDIASEIIPNDVLNNSTEFTIVYKKEIEYGDTIDCYYTDNTAYIYNKDKNILHCIITIK